MRPPRVVVLDSSLEANEGHHDHFVRHARRDLAARGIEMAVHGSTRVTPALSRELQVMASFSRSMYDPKTPDSYDGLLLDVFNGAARFADQAQRCLAESAGPGDMVLLPTANLEELAGLIRLAQRSPPTYSLALLFHRAGSGPFKAAGQGTLTGALLRNLGRGLSVFAPRGLWIGAVTEPLRATLDAPLDHPVHLAPSPTWYAQGRERPATPGKRIGVLGHLRVEKGCMNLPALVTALSVRLPQARCVIAGHQGRDDVGSELEAALVAAGAEVQFGWRDEEAFADLLAGCDLVVLPYDPEVYSDTSSGVFCHAVAHGLPVVAPEGTWMAAQIAQGRASGLAYARAEVEPVVATIAQALDRLDTLGPRAVARAPAWRRQECGGRLLDQLVSFGFGGRESSMASPGP